MKYYSETYFRETVGQLGCFGIKILTTLDREPSIAERLALQKAADLLLDAMQRTAVEMNPQTSINRREMRDSLVSLFPSPVFVEEIPNEYCSQPCCLGRPWLIVTTTVGRIKIGWRKRVINIDWKDSWIRVNGSTLFPDVKSTVGDHYVHAWTEDEARRYIAIILSSAEKSAA